MLMLDVRNAITSILDRYSLADVVEVTLRKMRRDGVPLPFSEPQLRAAAAGQGRKQTRAALAVRLQAGRGINQQSDRRLCDMSPMPE